MTLESSQTSMVISEDWAADCADIGLPLAALKCNCNKMVFSGGTMTPRVAKNVLYQVFSTSCPYLVLCVMGVASHMLRFAKVASFPTNYRVSENR